MNSKISRHFFHFQKLVPFRPQHWLLMSVICVTLILRSLPNTQHSLKSSSLPDLLFRFLWIHLQTSPQWCLSPTSFTLLQSSHPLGLVSSTFPFWLYPPLPLHQTSWDFQFWSSTSTCAPPSAPRNGSPLPLGTLTFTGHAPPWEPFLQIPSTYTQSSQPRSLPLLYPH